MRDLSCGDTRVYLEIEIRRVHCRSCGAVKQEKLPWLANNPFYTRRFAYYVGRRCRSATVRDVARELRLDWKMSMDPNRYAVSEPELLRSLRLSGRGGFLHDHPGIAAPSGTFWRLSADPAGSSQVRRGTRRSIPTVTRS